MTYLFIRGGLRYADGSEIELPRIALEDAPIEQRAAAEAVAARVGALASAASAEAWIAAYSSSYCRPTLLRSEEIH